MYYLFGGCKALTSLNIRNFDTKQVKDMSKMFLECTSLTSLDISSFDTQEVITTSQMFKNS